MQFSSVQLCSGMTSRKVMVTTDVYIYMEPLLKVHPDERPPPLERPLDNVNLNINVLISSPDEKPPLLICHFSGAKRR